MVEVAAAFFSFAPLRALRLGFTCMTVGLISGLVDDVDESVDAVTADRRELPFEITSSRRSAERAELRLNWTSGRGSGDMSCVVVRARPS